MPNAQCPIPNAQFPIPNSQFPIPNSQFPIPNSQIFPDLMYDRTSFAKVKFLMLRNQTVRLKGPARFRVGCWAGACAVYWLVRSPLLLMLQSFLPLIPTTATPPSSKSVRSLAQRSNWAVGAEVIELQAALKLLGLYSDTVDGIFSQSTAQAVSKFQEAAGRLLTV